MEHSSRILSSICETCYQSVEGHADRQDNQKGQSTYHVYHYITSISEVDASLLFFDAILTGLFTTHVN